MADHQHSDDDYAKKLMTIVQSSYKVLPLALGYKLKLFDNLPEANAPKTAQEIAHSANMKERYVREWLGAMVADGFVECDKAGKTFWLPESGRATLKNPDIQFLLVSSLTIPALSRVFDRIAQCFSPDGPLGISYAEAGDDIHSLISSLTDPVWNEHLIPDFIPSIPHLKEDLETGITCLDVACGSGKVVFLLASHFPRSQFYGFDIAGEVMEAGNKLAQEKSISNVHFVQGDARALPTDWISKFDFVTSFDGIHDQARPDLSLKEIYRVLKPGGRFSMVDTTASPNVYDHKTDPKAPFCYMASLFHCMPVSLYHPDGFGLGAMWGRDKAMALLKEAGFSRIDRYSLPWDKHDFQNHYIGAKTG